MNGRRVKLKETGQIERPDHTSIETSTSANCNVHGARLKDHEIQNSERIFRHRLHLRLLAKKMITVTGGFQPPGEFQVQLLAIRVLIRAIVRTLASSGKLTFSLSFVL